MLQRPVIKPAKEHALLRCGELVSVIRIARMAGWRIERTRKNHIKFVPPWGKGVVFFSGTTSDWRAVRNLRSKLRHHGLDTRV